MTAWPAARHGNDSLLAVMRALGLAKIGGVMRWHALGLVGPVIVAATIAALIAGSAGWVALADWVGFVPVSAMPIGLALVVAVAAIIIAIVIGTLSTARLSRDLTAELLSTE